MVENDDYHDSPLLTKAMCVGAALSIPVFLYIIGTTWAESAARQIAGTFFILGLLSFLIIKKKYEALLLAVIFLSQFSISLHTFDLTPSVKFQIFHSDVIIALFFLIALESRSQMRSKIRIDALGWLFIAWIGWLCIATCFSAYMPSSLIFLSVQVKFLVLYVLALNAKLTESLVKKVVYICVTIIVVQSMIGLAQLAHGGPLGLGILGESISKKIDNFVDGSLRMSGTIGATNAFAGYFSLLLVVLLPFVVVCRTVLNYLALSLGLILLVLALSRAGWLGFMVGSICALFMLLRSRLVTFSRILLFGFAGLIIIGAGVTVYFDKIINRFEDSQAVESATGRLDQFKSAWPLIDKRLITGIGPGVSTLFSRWNPDRKHIQKALSGKAMPNAIHCAQLQVLVESGIPGLVLFMVITGVILWSVFRKEAGVSKHDMILLLNIGSVGAAVSVLVHISFGTELNNQQIFIMFWALLGLTRNMASGNVPDGDGNLPLKTQQNMNWRSHEEK